MAMKLRVPPMTGRIATHNRDGFSGQDYADQRYYASSYGRFDSFPYNSASQMTGAVHAA